MGVNVHCGADIRAQTEVFEAVTDNLVLHDGDPQPLHGLSAARQIVYRAEDSLALASSVAGVDHLRNIVAAHKAAQEVELLFLVRQDFETPRTVFQQSLIYIET